MLKRVHKDGSAQITEKKSRFIGDVYNIENEEDALYYINETKKKYWDARHHCYAYIIGNNNEIKRFSDDGEPSGTAGKPILDVLDKSGIANCLIIVTRYFGGTLLGTGGLIRAYSEAAKSGIEASGIMEVKKGIQAQIDADYNSFGKIQYMCMERNIIITDTEYGENVHINMIIEESEYAHFQKAVADAFAGRLEIVKNDNVIFGIYDGMVQILTSNN
ncbi:MAG: YigZ family protein [Eubacterium sp. 36_13]|nr:MAG: YigZ family protein [Eubacterium sp. 36_13]